MSTISHAPVTTRAERPTASYAERNARYWRRNLAVCVFGSFTTLVSLSMLLPFLPLYVRQLGVDAQSAVIQWSGIAFGATFLGTAVTGCNLVPSRLVPERIQFQHDPEQVPG